jgi:hypothetical protein
MSVVNFPYNRFLSGRMKEENSRFRFNLKIPLSFKGIGEVFSCRKGETNAQTKIYAAFIL